MRCGRSPTPNCDRWSGHTILEAVCGRIDPTWQFIKLSPRSRSEAAVPDNITETRTGQSSSTSALRRGHDLCHAWHRCTTRSCPTSPPPVCTTWWATVSGCAWSDGPSAEPRRRGDHREDALGDLGLRVRHAPRRADRVAHELALLVLDVPAEPSRRGDSSIRRPARDTRAFFFSRRLAVTCHEHVRWGCARDDARRCCPPPLFVRRVAPRRYESNI